MRQFCRHLNVCYIFVSCSPDPTTNYEITNPNFHKIQFGIIQNLQMSPIPQTIFLIGTFWAVSYNKPALVIRFLKNQNEQDKNRKITFFTKDGIIKET